jgi:MerR family transcriptional regulator, copper efflux regulator
VRARRSPNLADYLTIAGAAEFLGVSASTLRNWDRTGKLRASRHPMNGYRIYRSEQLEAILKEAARGAFPRLSEDT